MASGSAFVLDDDSAVRRMIAQVLQISGFAVEDFATPKAMLAALAESVPSLIVLDLSLGESDAVEVMRELALRSFDGCVLLVSGHDTTTLQDAGQIGARHGLSMLPPLGKPFRASELRDRLKARPHIETAPAGGSRSSRAPIDVAEALDAGWLELWYQPKIDVRTFAVCGAEALLRARHPVHGIVSPADILPSPNDPAHERLAEFVIRQSMRDWRYFADRSAPMKLSVNMPVSVITGADFISLIRHHLPQDQDFPGLIVEVTEDEIVDDATWIHEVSTQLKLYGVSLSIDDFGVAHSGMSRLLDLPSVELKLDRRFVDGCSSDSLKHSLCQTVIDLAHRIGSRVCAEGVETVPDLEAIAAMGCDSVQGYLFARPMAPQPFISAIEDGECLPQAYARMRAGTAG